MGHALDLDASALAAATAADPTAAAAVALARLYGEPLFALPIDLYIPPDALEVILEAFEGPLDLLLYLIRKQNFNILDIPMAALTRQYLAYVDEVRSRNLELAAEYLLMAAMRKVADGEEAGDPRAELVRRLLEYEQMKHAAAQLAQLPQSGRDFWAPRVVLGHSFQPPLPEVTALDLQQAWRDIAQRARLVQHHLITREQLSVRETMAQVLKALQGRRFAPFEDLFDVRKGHAVLVVTFVALLELAKETLVEIIQAEAFAPIYVRLAYTPS